MKATQDCTGNAGLIPGNALVIRSSNGAAPRCETSSAGNRNSGGIKVQDPRTAIRGCFTPGLPDSGWPPKEEEGMPPVYLPVVRTERRAWK